MSDRKTGKKTAYTDENQYERKPFTGKTFLFYGLVGSSMLFLALTLLYTIWISRNTVDHNFTLPKIFTVSTVVILLSSFSLSLANKAFKEDDTTTLLSSLATTFTLSIVFCGLQFAGWIDMIEAGLNFNSHNGVAFLYIISGLHFLHVVGGIIYLFYLNLKAFDIWNDPIKSLVFFSNKYELTRIQLFSSYWHFIDVLWAILFFTFLFTM
jgi:cytochrome c oxidase subunit 3